MIQNIHLIQSKLMPQVASDCIERDRFNHLFIDITKKKLTTVIAGAGFGKTTFVSQAMKAIKGHAVWYRLDQYDSNFTLFLRYLIAGVEKHYPDFGIKTLGRLNAWTLARMDA